MIDDLQEGFVDFFLEPCLRDYRFGNLPLGGIHLGRHPRVFPPGASCHLNVWNPQLQGECRVRFVGDVRTLLDPNDVFWT